MSNWKRINQIAGSTAAMVVLCQDYVLADEEFLSNPKMKKNMNNSDFWVDMAETLYGSVQSYLDSKSEHNEGYDECDESGITDIMIVDFVMNPENRFELNDIICDTIDEWLKHLKKFK